MLSTTGRVQRPNDAPMEMYRRSLSKTTIFVLCVTHLVYSVYRLQNSSQRVVFILRGITVSRYGGATNHA